MKPFLQIPAVALAFFLGVGVHAQDPGCASEKCEEGGGVVEGVVFDSTATRPLVDARVVVVGTALDTRTDEDGHFELAGVPVGAREITFWHPRLQTLGVGPVPQTAFVTDGRSTEVLLAVPSRSTLNGLWCALEPGGRGDRVVSGVVTDSVTGVPLPGARIVLREIPRSDDQVEREQEVKAGRRGEYRFCDVSGRHWISIQARFGAKRGEPVMLGAEGAEVEEVDLPLAVSKPGVIRGVVVNWGDEEPLAGAELTLEGTDFKAVTGSEGGFVLEDIPPGRHLLNTSYLGYMERTDSVTVLGDEAVGVEVRLSKEPIPLEPLRVTVRAQRGLFDEATMGTRFDGLSRTEIDAILPRVSSMNQLLRQARIPGLSVREVIIYDAGIQLPALCVETFRRQAKNPGECNMVEVYVDDVRLASPEYVLKDLDPQTVDRVQVLSGLEGGSRYGGNSQNSVLLIYTRRHNNR